MTTRYQPGYGEGTVEIAQDDPAVVQLTDQLRSLFGAAKYQPPVMPRVAIALQELFDRSVEDFDKIRAVIETDPLVAAGVMRRARSAVYGSVPVGNLKDALSRLGLIGVRDAVWEFVMGMRVFRSATYAEPIERIRRHSVIAGRIARVVGRHAGVDAQHTFLCALLHDVGFSAALVVCAEELKPAPAIDAKLALAIDEIHVELSAMIARLWQLPQTVQEVIRLHHTLKVGGKIHPVPALVFIADDLATQLGAPVRISPQTIIDRDDPELMEAAFESLGISDAKLKLIGPEAQRAAQEPL